MFDYFYQPRHTYSVVVTDSNHRYCRSFSSRENAKLKMYALCRKWGVQVVKVWDDNHDKTYICSDGSQFHINRE